MLMPLPRMPALHNDLGLAALPGVLRGEEEANNGDTVSLYF